MPTAAARSQRRFDFVTQSRTEVKGRPVEVGLILLDSSLKPLYSNEEALRVLFYPKEPVKGKTANVILAERVSAILDEKSVSESSTIAFMSGRRRYICRSFWLGSSFDGSPEPSIAVTIERDRQPLYNLEVRFQLTEREREAVEHLTEGLTSKEIARRMNISPHTVKTFLRLVMIKMGVTTRSGVIGKIIDAAH